MRLSQILTVLLFVLINGIVLRNAVLHDPWVGYDSPEHLRYVEVLSTGRFPTSDDTAQFFSSPLPYLLPALACNFFDSIHVAARIGLLQNVIVSLLLTWTILRIAKRLKPGEEYFPPFALAILGSLPVYYKSFAFFRGEPFVALFVTLAVYESLCFLSELAEGKSRRGYMLGVYCAGMALARQWGVFAGAGLFAGLLLLVHKQAIPFATYRRYFFQSMALCVVLSSKFYLPHIHRHDDLKPFNREAAVSFSFANQPAKFYFGLGRGKLFTKPLRPSFANQLLPIFYTEIWADYWMYFNVYGLDTKTRNLKSPKNLTLKHGVESWVETNRGPATTAAARANRFGLPLTVLFITSGVTGLAALFFRASSRALVDQHAALSGAVIMFSLLGYLWFLVSYPNHSKGDTIKATYMLHIFPLLALMSASLVSQIATRRSLGQLAVALYLLVCLPLLAPQFFSSNTKTFCLRAHGEPLLEKLDKKGTCFFDPTPTGTQTIDGAEETASRGLVQ